MKCWLSGLEFTNCLSEQLPGKPLIRQLCHMQSDLGLECLSSPFCQEANVQNFRIFTINWCIFQCDNRVLFICNTGSDKDCLCT